MGGSEERSKLGAHLIREKITYQNVTRKVLAQRILVGKCTRGSDLFSAMGTARHNGS